MTWVVGANSLFGSAFIASDIRVTFPDSTTLDCLQKVHYLGDVLVGAFAGSVAAGFALVETLRQEFQPIPVGTAWDLPQVSATWLPRVLRRRFSMCPDHERSRRASLMIAAQHPTETMGDIGFPRTHVYVYRSPNFEPQMTRGPECVAIGSGADVEKYREAIAELTTRFEFHKLIEGGPGAQPTTLIFDLHRIVKDLPVDSVSSLFHVGFVERGKVRVRALDFTEHANGSSRRITLPPVAPTYEVFQAMCRARGYADASIAAAEC